MATQRVMIWVREGLWEAAVDAALAAAGPATVFTLLHVIPTEVEGAVRAGFGGLFGRHRPIPADLHELLTEADKELLDAAEARLGAATERRTVEGRIEREVAKAADGADLLVVSRDGDRARLGPHSIGPATRFVIDHAPCPVLLVWPGDVPSVQTIPPPPPH